MAVRMVMDMEGLEDEEQDVIMRKIQILAAIVIGEMHRKIAAKLEQKRPA